MVSYGGTAVKFGVLGTLQVIAGEPGSALPVRLRTLLAVLLWRANQPVLVDELAELVWDGVPPRQVPDATRALVMRLRRQLDKRAAARIVTRAPGYVIEISGDELDAAQFETLTREAGAAVRAHQWAQAARTTSKALGLWRGTPLSDIPSQLLRDQWVPQLNQLHVQALEWRTEADLRDGRHEQLIPELLDLSARHPLREQFHGQLMLALYRAGRQAEALSVYRDARDVLVTELGVEPGPGLRELHQRILSADPALALTGPARLAAAEPEQVTPREPPPAVPGDMRFSLPPDSAAFTGREAELDRIMVTVLNRTQDGGVLAIYAIGGMPGIGKTALAVHAAHVLRGQFPGRCLFIDLHAHAPGHDPVSPQAALAGLLAAAGVDARNLPGDVEGLAALWRDKLAGQRTLLVLDNAASSRQVAPLLPGGDGCLVLVTSRRHLADLPGVVTPLLLDTLPQREARDMFARLAPRAAADPDESVAELISLAGYLPLAISLLARVYARRPSWTVADLVTETKASLLSLTAENDSVAAAFDVSYRDLDPVQQQFFTLLGLHPGSTTDAYAASALAGIRLAEAIRLLDELHREGLLTETGYRRYGMHDLLRRYARDHAAALPALTSERAVGQLLDYYQYAAARAGVCLWGSIRFGALPAEPAVPPAAPDLDDVARAQAWAQAERANLLACLDQVNPDQPARVIALTAALAAILRYDGSWADAIARHTTALEAAQRLGDRLGQARALNDLGDVRRLTDDFPGAADAQEQALSIYRDLGDRLGQANTLYHLAAARGATGDNPVTVRHLERALSIFRDLGSRIGQACTLNYLGNVREQTGDYPGAAQAQEQALSIFRDLDSPIGEAGTLNYLGKVRRMTGDYPGAAQAQEQALSVYRDLGSRLGQANTLNQLGELRRMTGDCPGAARAQEQALSIFRDLGARLGQANALLGLGAARRATGDPGAAQALQQALGIYRDLGDRDGEAEALNETGILHRATGDLAHARACHRRALELARAITSSWAEAHALAGLGRCALAAADLTTALANLGQAAEIFQQIGAAEASLIAAELAKLRTTKPAT
jgi:DNA-binding SARP family transcriptional activator/tetratricopeptide (TPR) repeat protein